MMREKFEAARVEKTANGWVWPRGEDGRKLRPPRGERAPRCRWMKLRNRSQGGVWHYRMVCVTPGGQLA